MAPARDVLGDFGEQAAQAGSDVRLAAAELVVADGTARLDQVLANLCRTPSSTAPGALRVTVAAATRARCIADRGIGIAPANAARIFERFERAVSAEHYGGLGLGLYIVRRIVDAHGGTPCTAGKPAWPWHHVLGRVAAPLG